MVDLWVSGVVGCGFGRWVLILILILRLMSFDFVYDFFKLMVMWWLMVARFVVVTVVVGLMEICFYMQNQTLKIILPHIFHKADKQLKIFSFRKTFSLENILYLENILHITKRSLHFCLFFLAFSTPKKKKNIYIKFAKCQKKKKKTNGRCYF